jgi:hypothetical protein
LLEAARYKGAYGGRGSGKSHFFGELMVEECLRVPGTLAVCIREVHSKRMIESHWSRDGQRVLDLVFTERRLDKARRSTALLNTGLASD